MKFVVTEHNWLHNIDEPYLNSYLYNDEGELCCMGFRELKKGRNIKEINGVYYPSELYDDDKDDWIVKRITPAYSWERLIGNINDYSKQNLLAVWKTLCDIVPHFESVELVDSDNVDVLRKQMLTEIFKYHNEEIIFEP